MALYLRGDIWHYDFTRDGFRHRGSTGLRDKRAAKGFEDRERARAALGGDPRQSYALEDVATLWVSARVADKRSAKDTSRRVETMLRLFGPRTPITAIDTPQIEAAIAKRRLEPKRNTNDRGVVSNSTINRDLIDSTLRPLMRYARRVLKMPVKEIVWTDVRLPEPRERVRSFSAAELAAFRAALPRWHRPLFDFISRYGVRLKEAFFPLDALDLDTGRVTLRERKGQPGRSHTIRLLDEDQRLLAAMAGRAREAGLETIWFREVKGGALQAIRWRGFQSAAGRAVVAAGLIDTRAVHDLRHHAGTAILRATGNLQVARKLLGHESIQSTVRYAHASDDDVLEGLRHASATTPAKVEEMTRKDRAVGDD